MTKRIITLKELNDYKTMTQNVLVEINNSYIKQEFDTERVLKLIDKLRRQVLIDNIKATNKMKTL